MKPADAKEAAARAHTEIAHPANVVRAQFFDADHHIRQRIHHGVTLEWLPPNAATPNERRIRQEMKVMTRSHVDDFVIEEDSAQHWVKRFVDGPNAGARFVATFTEEEPARTRVDIEAFAGKGGFDNGLGKLSQLGLEKALQRLLEEHKRALEGYEPGRARGQLHGVIATLRHLTSPMAAMSDADRRALVSNLLEAAALVAIADEVADPAERETLRAVARTLCFTDVSDDAAVKLIADVKQALAKDGIETRCDKVGARLKQLRCAQLGLAIAALVAQISHGIAPPELAAMQRLARAAGVNEAELTSLVRTIDKGLSR